MPTPRIALWHLTHALWQCAFRPFFALTVLSAIGLMALWAIFLLLGWPLPMVQSVPGGPFVWHAHELLLGFALAATCGFALTAVPEFTGAADIGARAVRRLVLLWLAGRCAFWLSGFGADGWWGLGALAVSGALHVALLLYLAALLAPPLWRDAERRHLSFLWAVLLMAFVTAGFYVDALRGEYPMRWLLALVGLLMALIVVTMSRISMRMVNDAIDAHAARHPLPVGEDGLPQQPEPYLARPPRRHMAVLCIAFYSLAQWAAPWWAPLGGISAWLALAASAAMLALMGDWHVGRPLFTRWPLLLYAVYACMAIGYGLLGLAELTGMEPPIDGLAIAPGAGMHMLSSGAMGLGVYMVMVIAGYTHSGLDKNGRPWVIAGALCLLLGALLRVWAYSAEAVNLWMGAASALWCAAFALMAWQMLPVWLSPRTDGRQGCAGRD